MYKIYADEVLIYDSTLEDYKIGKGEITKEVGKSGSFVFSIYPDHPFYDGFVAIKTVITVYKSGRIVFRGRVLDDKVDYWNNKVLTCEGELGFLQDSIVRPYSFQGSPASLFAQFINGHNAQVDEFKKFKVGTVDIEDANDYINRSSTDYSATQAMLESALIGSGLGGYIYVTHGDDGTDPVPTINYVKDFSKVATQRIEFGANLKDYVKTTDAADTATAIIPLGTQNSTEGGRLTIEEVNGGKDYIYSEVGVALRGWVFKTAVWDDVNLAQNLKAKAEAYLEHAVNQNITVELNAIDLHLLDHDIESFNVCEYVQVSSVPHNFDAVLLCNKQTLNLLKPENDTVVLGYKTASFTGASTQMAASVSTLGKKVSSIQQDGASIKLQVQDLEAGTNSSIEQTAASIRSEIADEVEGLNSTIEQTASSIRSEIANDVEGLNSTINQTADEIRLEIDHTNGDISLLEQKVDSLTLSVTNGEQSSKIELRAGDLTISSHTIKFTGDVVFASDLEDGNTVISGDCITTGTISADRLQLGGEMYIYDSLKSTADPAGYFGYLEGTIFSSPFVGCGIISMNDTAVLASEEDDVLVAASDDIGLYAGGKVLINSEYLIPTTDAHTYCGSYSYWWFDGYFDTLHVGGAAIETSDSRQKENVSYDLTQYLEVFDQLKPCSYKYIKGQRTHLGMIAQEVEGAAAEAGFDLEHFAAVCINDENDVYGLRYTEFVPLLIAKVQQLDTELKELKNA